MLSLIKKIVGTKNDREIKRIRPYVDAINQLETEYQRLSDAELKAKTEQFKKKLAEAIHADLSSVAKRADLDTIVGLGSGSSEDWKVILKSSYEVPRKDILTFHRTITDLQYRHLQYELMVALTGNPEYFTLRRKGL